MSKRQTRALIVLVVLVLLYFGRSIVGSFVLAGLVAYLLSPLVNLLHRKVRLPRLLAVLLIYLLFLVVLGSLFYFLVTRLFSEAKEFRGESLTLMAEAKRQLANSPDWLQAIVTDGIKSLQNVTLSIPTRILPFFSGAVSHFINLLIFLTATLYLIKDGPGLVTAGERFLVSSGSEKMLLAFQKMTQTFSRFLRSQIFLVFLMATVSFLVLVILDVKFALLIGILTGFAEVIPVVGPIFATMVAATVAAADGRGMFGLDPVAQAGVVVLVYFILRQLEDLVIIPHVMSRIAGVHPLMIMFAVLLAGHLAGAWGLFLAVPLLAVLKSLFEIYW